MNDVESLVHRLKRLPYSEACSLMTQIESIFKTLRHEMGYIDGAGEKQIEESNCSKSGLPDHNRSDKYVKIEMNHESGDRDAGHIQIDAEDCLSEIDDEIDIMVEEDGKITQISAQELKKIQDKFVEKLKHTDLKEQDYIFIEQVGNNEAGNIINMDERFALKVENDYICKSCMILLSSKKALESHMNAFHPGQAMFVCVQCEKRFASEIGLVLHIQNKHPKNLVNMLCCDEENCNYSTHSKQLFRAHRTSHEKNSCMKCPICFKDYLGGPKAFRNHMKLHTNEKNYSCELCDKRFVSQSRLTHHRTTVHDPPKFQCDFCSKLFRSKVNFERHLLIHNDEKPYTCEFCDYQARNAGNLTSHVKVIHKFEDYTAGKKKKILKKERITKRILEQQTRTSYLKNVDDSDKLTEILGSNEAENYIGAIISTDLTIENLKLREEMQRTAVAVQRTKSNKKEKIIGSTISNKKKMKALKKATNSGTEDGFTLMNIDSIAVDHVEHVEDDGVVAEETKTLQTLENCVLESGSSIQFESSENNKHVMYIMNS